MKIRGGARGVRRPLVVQDVELAGQAAGAVRVEACGVCHTDPTPRAARSTGPSASWATRAGVIEAIQ
jgi:Zn-dependent alcohol dehydrogenase